VPQDPNAFLTILGKMTVKPEVKFDNLFPKLYNPELWLRAYQHIAANPGNMTQGVDGKTIDGFSLKLIHNIIADLKASRYKPKPVRRIYLPKPNNRGQRPIGIPSFQDKLLQTVLKFILEAIYEPLFSPNSHGFRPNRSCHTALAEVKKMKGVRWWVEGDISGFFNNLKHEVLLRILKKRITDQRFLHLIGQLLKAGYLEDWQYHQTYSGVPQGGNLSPVISNIYLTEFDQGMSLKAAEFRKGKKRRQLPEYRRKQSQIYSAKQLARQNGNWVLYKKLKRELRRMPGTDPADPDFRRLYFTRYADDWLIGVIGTKDEALELKNWVKQYLKNELDLELNEEKTLVTNAKKRIRFLGYDIKRWSGIRHLTSHTIRGIRTQRTTSYHLMLLLPRDKLLTFGRTYGNTANWRGKRRTKLLNLSELEILLTYNAEIRGFLGYYSLADNLTKEANRLLNLTLSSFLHTLASKLKSRVSKVVRKLKRGPGRYVITLQKGKRGEEIKEYELLASTRQLEKGKIEYRKEVDRFPNTWKYRSRNELSKRLLAQQCEWCGQPKEASAIEVHHVRKLKDLKGKALWEQLMIARKRKTMVLCHDCHTALHSGRLSEKNRVNKNLSQGELGKPRYLETG